jgi:hypothetical protein
VLDEPVSSDEMRVLELARLALAGELERVNRLIDEHEVIIRARLRPQ